MKFLGSLGPLIRRAGLEKSISRLTECPNQLVYFTIISFFVSNLSFPVEKLKISQLRPKLWPPEVEVKKFLELQSVKILKKINFLRNFHYNFIENHVFNFFFTIFSLSKFHLTSPYSRSPKKLCYWKAEKWSTSRLRKPYQM